MDFFSGYSHRRLAPTGGKTLQGISWQSFFLLKKQWAQLIFNALINLVTSVRFLKRGLKRVRAFRFLFFFF